MTVSRAEHVRSRRVDRRVYHVGRRVQQTNRTSVDDLAAVVDLDKVGGLDQGKRDAERVHPEGGRVDWIPECDVAGDSFVEAILAEDTEGGCQSSLEVFPLLVLVFEDWWSGEGVWRVHMGFLGSR